MLWFLIKRFFSRYRSEGCELPDARMLPAGPTDSYPEDVNDLDPYDHPYEVPGNRTAALKMYGNPGDTKLDPRWERENMVLVKGLPGSWNRGKGRLYCHRKAAPAIREFLRRCEIYGVLDYIVTMGCFNYRHMQHNPKMPISYHSFGVAFDINPAQNRAKRFKRGTAPRSNIEHWCRHLRHGVPEVREVPAGEDPEVLSEYSPRWVSVWPKGVPELLVKAAEESGFYWGGTWKSFVDPMHFQLVKF